MHSWEATRGVSVSIIMPAIFTVVLLGAIQNAAFDNNCAIVINAIIILNIGVSVTAPCTYMTCFYPVAFLHRSRILSTSSGLHCHMTNESDTQAYRDN